MSWNDNVKRCEFCGLNYVRCHNYCKANHKKRVTKQALGKLKEKVDNELDKVFSNLVDKYPELKLYQSGSITYNEYSIGSWDN